MINKLVFIQSKEPCFAAYKTMRAINMQNIVILRDVLWVTEKEYQKMPSRFCAEWAYLGPLQENSLECQRM